MCRVGWASAYMHFTVPDACFSTATKLRYMHEWLLVHADIPPRIDAVPIGGHGAISGRAAVAVCFSSFCSLTPPQVQCEMEVLGSARQSLLERMLWRRVGQRHFHLPQGIVPGTKTAWL